MKPFTGNGQHRPRLIYSQARWRNRALLLFSAWLVAAMVFGQTGFKANAAGTGPASQPAAGSSRAPGSKESAGQPVQMKEAGARRPDDISENNWANLYPHLTAVSAVSATDAWAVGDYGHLLHYIGATWVTVDDPALHGSLLSDVKMLSATEGWAVAGTKAFQYTGGAWVERSNGLSEDLTVTHISVVDSNNIWGYGMKSVPPPNTPDKVPTLIHWGGSRWIAGGPYMYSTIYLNAISMRGPSDGWVVGWEDILGAGPRVYHFDGFSWTPATPPPTGTEYGLVSGVWATGPGDVWMTGQDEFGVPYIYHSNGGQWTSWRAPEGTYPGSILMFSDQEGWALGSGSILHWDGVTWTAEQVSRDVTSISGVQGQLWAVGNADTILSKAGTGAWTQQRGGPTQKTLYSVSALSSEEAWAVGEAGTVVHYHAGTGDLVATPFTTTLRAVQMLSPTDGWAVGGNTGYSPGNGIIAHWDGTSWTRVATPENALRAIAMTGTGEGWAVGEQGAVWKATRGVWQAVDERQYGYGNLTGIAMDSPTHGWSVGDFGSSYGLATLFEYTQGQWVPHTYDFGSARVGLFGVALAPGGQRGWAAGSSTGWLTDQHPAIDLIGGDWSVNPLVTKKTIYSLAAESSGEAWAAGCGMFHFIDGIWQEQSAATNYCLYGLALVPGRGGWAVGTNGEILRYSALAQGQRLGGLNETARPLGEFLDIHALSLPPVLHLHRIHGEPQHRFGLQRQHFPAQYRPYPRPTRQDGHAGARLAHRHNRRAPLQ